MIKKIGFAFTNLAASQASAEFISAANDEVRNGDLAITAFVEQSAPTVVRPKFAIMSIFEAYGFDGVLVATNLQTAKAIAGCPRAKAHLFYLYDLDWLRVPRRDYHALADVYRNQYLRLVCRASGHVKPVADAWNKEPIGVIPDFKPKTFYDLAVNAHAKA